jgi:NAD/NADP transhydrogenase beta subunit
MNYKKPLPPALSNVESLAKLMDSQFRLPGTNFRFGLDAVIGLIPGVGDFSAFLVSAYLIVVMANNGASGYVMARMILNVLIDVVIGSIPFVGDILDFGFKANTKNVALMQKHYREGKYKGGAWKVVIPVLLLVFIVIGAIVYASWKLFEWLWQLLF